MIYMEQKITKKSIIKISLHPEIFNLWLRQCNILSMILEIFGWNIWIKPGFVITCNMMFLLIDDIRRISLYRGNLSYHGKRSSVCKWLTSLSYKWLTILSYKWLNMLSYQVNCHCSPSLLSPTLILIKISDM